MHKLALTLATVLLLGCPERCETARDIYDDAKVAVQKVAQAAAEICALGEGPLCDAAHAALTETENLAAAAKVAACIICPPGALDGCAAPADEGKAGKRSLKELRKAVDAAREWAEANGA